MHRIGRTGRCGKTGIATTFVNKACDESVLRDLKALLIETRQKVPPFLATLDTDEFIGEGCTYCGGVGHRITGCPKLEAIQQKEVGSIGRKDHLASSAANW